MPAERTRRRVGIEKLSAYPCSMSLDLDLLGAARGAEPEYASKQLLVQRRNVNPTWEDPVTMAVNAAKRILTPDDLAAIELLVVGTESSADQGKPISTFIWRHLGLSANCRNFETKHACFGGTAALMTAVQWVASGVAPGKKALVIATDQGRMHLGQPWEYVLGAGAVALLVSEQPEILEIELGKSGYWTAEVGDTFRPTSQHEAGNTENSVYCYLDAVQGSFEHYVQRVGEIDFDEHFRWNIYHMPFCAMAYRAHRALLRRINKAKRAESEAHFDRKVRPSLRYGQQVGGTYTGSTFYALAALVDHAPEVRPGDRVGMFAYGSGCCSEYYSALIGPQAKQRIAQLELQPRLDARYALTVEQYEAVERERTSHVDAATYTPRTDGLDDLYARVYAGKGLLVLRGLEGYFRSYDWS